MVPATTVAQGPYLLREPGRPACDVAVSQTYLILHVCHLFCQPSDGLRWGSEPSSDAARSCQLEISAVLAVRAEGLKNKPSLSFHPGLQDAFGTEMTLPCCIP